MSKFFRQAKGSDFSFKSLKGEIIIELTERCNNQCIHCNINQPENNKRAKSQEMPTDFIFGIIDQIAEKGFFSITLTGGEPLLREDFEAIYLHARRAGLLVRLFTNGRLITPDLCKLFARIPPRLPIEISVYGMHPKSYNAVAGVKGAYQEFWRGMTLLKQFNIPFNVRMIYLPQNKHEVDAFIKFSSNLPNVSKNLPSEIFLNFYLRARRDDPNKNLRIKHLRPSPEKYINFYEKLYPHYLLEMQDFISKFSSAPTDKLFNCGAGHTPSIDAYGNFQMCLNLRHPKTTCSLDPEAFQIHHPESKMTPFEYALTEFFPSVRQTRAMNPEYLRRCAKCVLKSDCQQCPAQSWSEHGTLDTPVEYFCEITHVTARHCDLIYENEKLWEIDKTEWESRVSKFMQSKLG